MHALLGLFLRADRESAHLSSELASRYEEIDLLYTLTDILGQALRLRTWVSGELKQDSNTAQMIFSTAEQIAHVSRLTGIVPGDLFATGTPAGVGMPRGTFLRHGDVVEIEIEGIGRLRNPVVQTARAG